MITQQEAFNQRRPSLKALRDMIEMDAEINVTVIRNPQGAGYLVRWHRNLIDIVHPVDTVLQAWHYYSGLRQAYRNTHTW